MTGNGARELIHATLGETASQTSREGAAVDCPCPIDPATWADSRASSTLSKAEMRGKIVALEETMKAMPPAEPGKLGRIDFETIHHFAPGIYMRELRIPKGATLTGKIHKTEHLNVLSKGKLRLVTEDGVRDVEASMVILSKPGTKRAAHALEDSVWITVHPNVTEERDIGRLEDMLVVETFAQLEEHQRKQLQGGDPCRSSE